MITKTITEKTMIFFRVFVFELAIVLEEDTHLPWKLFQDMLFQQLQVVSDTWCEMMLFELLYRYYSV